VRRVIIALLGLPLAACAPKPLPDWSVSRTVPRVAAVRVQPVPALWPEGRDRGPPSHVTPTKPEAELLPFTPEWQAREDEFDKRLRRTMNICRNC